jgi:hypothetical protein
MAMNPANEHSDEAATGSAPNSTDRKEGSRSTMHNYAFPSKRPAALLLRPLRMVVFCADAAGILNALISMFRRRAFYFIYF